jgi:ribosome biogenesis GTPase
MEKLTLEQLGWRDAFRRPFPEDDALVPVRVVGVERSGWLVIGVDGERQVDTYTEDERRVTVGDWLLLDGAHGRAVCRLDRLSLFKRRAPGTDRKEQLIAANIDTLFIVSSCNDDFNEARLERYLALGSEAGVMTVVILTKVDECASPGDYVSRATRLAPGLIVEAVDARDRGSLDCLDAWLGVGQTVALLGSSGVGKSTIANTLTGKGAIPTQPVREDDAKGRHTTTARHMYRLDTGAWIVDTPGMREIQLVDVGSGIDDVFAEISSLAARCRFADCGHESEPGCAVLEAIEAGDITATRVARWRKLVREEAINRETVAERRARGKSLGRLYRDTLSDSHARKGRR